jgi:hypothetical protein
MKTVQKTFFYNPDDPKKSFDVYIDKDPSDTIPIKYTHEKTPWCTCSGSSVCGYYNDRFKKTKIAFMNNPYKKQIAYNIESQKCEKYVRDKMGVIPHLTSGIDNKLNTNTLCNKIKYKPINYGKTRK